MAAQIRTQDSQKVVDSAQKQVESFVNGVRNANANSKNLTTIYNNLSKVIDAFNDGVLSAQGANSDYVLRTIYRQLGEQYIDILQNENAVSKIVDEMRKLTPSRKNTEDNKAQKPAQNNTSDDVETDDYQDDNHQDIIQYTIDFVNDLQYVILKVRQNLIKERNVILQNIQNLKELQEQDIEQLDGVFKKQMDDTINQLNELNDMDEKVQTNELAQTNKLLNEFNKAADTVGQKLDSVTANIDRITFDKNEPIVKLPQQMVDIDQGKLIEGVRSNVIKSLTYKNLFSGDKKSRQIKKGIFKGKATHIVRIVKVVEKIKFVDKRISARHLKKAQQIKQKFQKSTINKPRNQNNAFKSNKAKKTTINKTLVQKIVKSIVKTNIVNKPVVNKQVINKPIVNKTIVNKLIVNKPVVNKPITQKLITQKPIVNKRNKRESVTKNIGSNKRQKQTLNVRSQKPKLSVKKLGVKKLQNVGLPIQRQFSPKPGIPKLDQKKGADRKQITKPKLTKPESVKKTIGLTEQRPKPIIEKPKKENTKLQVKPSGGMCICPICGSPHQIGKPHKHKEDASKQKNSKVTQSPIIQKPIEQKPIVQKPIIQKPMMQQPAPAQNGAPANSPENDISSQKTTEYMWKVSGKVSTMLKKEKFKKQFTIDLPGIQKHVGGQIAKFHKKEEDINKDLSTVERNYNILKKNQNGSGNLLVMLLTIQPLVMMAGFVVVGGLLLLTLMRMAFASFKSKYVPESSKSEGGLNIFGISIPNWEEIKNFGIGIYNFITVALPSVWRTLKRWGSDIRKRLFDRNTGIMSSMAQMKKTLWKIGMAFIAGITKKAVGGALGFLVGLIATLLPPPAGLIVKVLADIMPLIYVFVVNQLTKIWADRKEQQELRMAQLKKKLSTTNIQSEIAKFSKNIKPFVPPSAIPGLETPQVKNGVKIPGKAIMRNVQLRTHGDHKVAKTVQKEQIKEQTKEFKKQADSGKESGVATKIIQTVGKSMSYENGINDAPNMVKQKVIQPQINKLGKYIESLNKSTRFKGLQGSTLYDINTGWNPKYRVHASDLMSAIPLNPFEEIHDKADVPIGEPGEGSDTYVGVIPFRWMQDGIPVTINPITFEIERAKKLIDLYQDVGKQIDKDMPRNSWWRANPNIEDVVKSVQGIIKDFSEKWFQYNHAKHSTYKKFDYRNRFEKFLEAMRTGRVQDQNNNLGGFEAFSKHDLDYTPPKMSARDVTTYVKLPQPENTSGGFWSAVKNIRAERKANKQAQEKMEEIGKISYGNLDYMTVRKMFFEEGIVNLFSNRQILNPVDKVNTILNSLSKHKLLSGKSSKKNPFDKMMEDYFEFKHIIGYDFDKIRNDKQSLAGFAQSIMEYFGLVVLPLFNKADKLLYNYIQDVDDKDKFHVDLRNVVSKLLNKFDFHNLIIHLTKYLRFPNIKTIVVDETNAKTWRDRNLVARYMRKQGFISREQMDKNLYFLGHMPTRTSEGRKRKIARIKELLKKARNQYKLTGEGGDYVSALKKQLRALTGAKKKKIPKYNSQGTQLQPEIDTKPLVPEKSAMEKFQEEQERKRKEEEERIKQEEERKKKLEEDAKRKEELVIAQAKIAEMERIKKEEKAYEDVLAKMVSDPASLTDAELKSVEKDLNNIKQEAENRINQLPREQRELKLALIRGDKVSPKTFNEMKKTAIGLHGSLQDYITEVNQIPCGSIVAVQNQIAPSADPVKLIDSDEIDMGE